MSQRTRDDTKRLSRVNGLRREDPLRKCAFAFGSKIGIFFYGKSLRIAITKIYIYPGEPVKIEGFVYPYIEDKVEESIKDIGSMTVDEFLEENKYAICMQTPSDGIINWLEGIDTISSIVIEGQEITVCFLNSLSPTEPVSTVEEVYNFTQE